MCLQTPIVADAIFQLAPILGPGNGPERGPVVDYEREVVFMFIVKLFVQRLVFHEYISRKQVSTMVMLIIQQFGNANNFLLLCFYQTIT